MSIVVTGMFLVLSACKYGGPYGHGGSISWVEFIHINDTEYTQIHSAVLADERFVGGKIGEVKFKVDGNVTNPSYQLKNGDAAYLEKGTDLYSVEGHQHLLAVPSDYEVNGYQLYSATGVRGYDWRFQGVPLEKVKKVEIYEGYLRDSSFSMELDGLEMERFLQLLTDSEEHAGYQPNWENRDPDMYAVVLYTGEAFAYKYLLQYDGVNYFWYPWDTALISEEIGDFLENGKTAN